MPQKSKNTNQKQTQSQNIIIINDVKPKRRKPKKQEDEPPQKPQPTTFYNPNLKVLDNTLFSPNVQPYLFQNEDKLNNNLLLQKIINKQNKIAGQTLQPAQQTQPLQQTINIQPAQQTQPLQPAPATPPIQPIQPAPSTPPPIQPIQPAPATPPPQTPPQQQSISQLNAQIKNLTSRVKPNPNPLTPQSVNRFLLSKPNPFSPSIKLNEFFAAKTLQSAVRAKLQREAENEAALKVQKVFKGSKVRKDFKDYMNKLIKETDAEDHYKKENAKSVLREKLKSNKIKFGTRGTIVGIHRSEAARNREAIKKELKDLKEKYKGIMRP